MSCLIFSSQKNIVIGKEWDKTWPETLLKVQQDNLMLINWLVTGSTRSSTLTLKQSNLLDLVNSAVKVLGTIPNWYGKIPPMWAVDGPNSNTEGSQATLKTFWSAIMVLQLMSGNSLFMTLPKIHAIVLVLAVTPRLACVHLIANLQFGLPGMDGLNARRVVEREKGTEIDSVKNLCFLRKMLNGQKELRIPSEAWIYYPELKKIKLRCEGFWIPNYVSVEIPCRWDNVTNILVRVSLKFLLPKKFWDPHLLHIGNRYSDCGYWQKFSLAYMHGILTKLIWTWMIV